MNISQQIKALEKEAKEARYWKERYQELRQELLNATARLGELVGVLVDRKGRRSTTKAVELAETYLYAMMVSSERMTGTGQIEDAIRQAGNAPTTNTVVDVRKRLRQRKDIGERREEGKTFLYWIPQESENASEAVAEARKQLVEQYGQEVKG